MEKIFVQGEAKKKRNYNSSIKWGVVIAYGEQWQISDL